MMTFSQLRKKYRPASPQEVLDNLCELFDHPKVPADYKPPVLTVVLSSGHSFRGYVLESSGQGETRSYMFSLEIENEGDGGADLMYVSANRVEAVTVWNIDDYPGTLPR